MPHTRADLLIEIIGEAMRRPPDERGAYIRGACADEADRGEAERLLAAAERAGRFMEGSTLPWAARACSGEAPGAVIGRYTLLEQIGEGGFGVVFRAEQREPVHRTVALKIIKLGMDTRAVVARFEAERQALAVMEHPCIAKVLDAGSTDAGRPYFVMELVRGEAITRFCDSRGLGARQRLDLFVQVCLAVQHAHTKGIIHRDLKPANILVSEEDGRALPRIIDFGIAKATGIHASGKAAFTEARQFVGTPEYMSPEQAQSPRGEVDTRTDVYSLGVLLYELLTGATPLDGAQLRSAAWDQMLRMVREQEPVRPSTRVSTRVNGGPRTPLAPDPAALRGDLDWIVMRCLEKDPVRRYQTAEGLAADIERHVRGEAVLAAPPSRTYRARKFVGRHRTGVGTAALVALALVAGLGAALWQAGIAARERDRVEQRSKELEQVASFQAAQLRDIDVALMGARLRDDLIADFQAAMERSNAPALEVRAARDQFAGLLSRANMTNVALRALDRTILARALVAVDEQFKEQPLVRARLLLNLGTTLTRLGLPERATAPMAEGLAIRQRLLGKDHPDTIEAVALLATMLGAQGRPDESEARSREALGGYRRILGEDHPDTLTAMVNLASVLQRRGELTESETLLTEALRRQRRVLAPDDRRLIGAIANMGNLLQLQGKLSDAEPYSREAMEKFRAFRGDHDPFTLQAIANQGALLQQLGRLPEAEGLLREALEKRRHVLGEDHPSTLDTMLNIGTLLRTSGRESEAEPYLVEALAKSRRRLPDGHPFTIMAMRNLGRLYQAQGRTPEAEALIVEALAQSRRALKGDHQELHTCVGALADLRFDQGRYAEAGELYREAITGLGSTLGADHPRVATSRMMLGRTMIAAEAFADAERELLLAEPILRAAQMKPGNLYPTCVSSLAALYARWNLAEPGEGYDQKAAHWRSVSVEIAPQSNPPGRGRSEPG